MATIPMSVYAPNRVTGANLTTQGTACTSGNTYTLPNDGRTKLVVANASGGDLTVTVTTVVTADGLTIVSSDRVMTATNPDTQVFGPFDQITYGTTLNFAVSGALQIIAVTG